ncbi:MAG: hypothetical protein JWM05_794 [Acidimicrobiales bacterium]|nr:hypothetical protein [Acidimicrobiales bacterium]
MPEPAASAPQSPGTSAPPGGRRHRRQRPKHRLARRRRHLRPATVGLTLFLALMAADVALAGGGLAPGQATSTPAPRTRAGAPVTKPPAPSPPVPVAVNPIQAENQQPGAHDWTIEDDVLPRAIEGFLDRASAQAGDDVRLFVRARMPLFKVRVLRLGWYHGAGARVVWTSGDVLAAPQPECLTLPLRNTVDCSNWSPTLSLHVDASWVPGQYLVRLEQPDGRASFVPFVVRDDRSHAAVLVVAGVTTAAAYDTWGGHGLYSGPAGTPQGRSTAVSLDRPYGGGVGGSAYIFGGTFGVASLLEAEGADVTYATSVDQHERPELMRNHRVIVSGGHDEYYSLQMRDGLEAARDAGVNIVFLGANAVFRRVRFEPSPLGPNRVIVNYRSTRGDQVAALDPTLATTSWRDPPVVRPESTLTANWYECNEAGLKADWVVVDAGGWMFEGTGLTNGAHVPDMVRSEYDRVVPGRPLPENLQIVTHSPLTCHGRPSFSDMTYATYPSGAGVLNTGTLEVDGHLGPRCSVAPRPGTSLVDCIVRQLLGNVLREFAAGPAGRRHPAEANVVFVNPPRVGAIGTE